MFFFFLQNKDQTLYFDIHGVSFFGPSGSQSVIPGPALAASLETCWKCKFPHPLSDSETLEGGVQQCVLSGIGDSDAY